MYLFKGDAPLHEFASVMKQPTKLGIKLIGRHFLKSYPYEDLYLLKDARQIRAAVKLPMILLGGVTDRAGMDTAMAEGFQFVAMARALLREPDLINRIQDEPSTESLCIHCNKCMTAIYGGTHCVLSTERPGVPRVRDETIAAMLLARLGDARPGLRSRERTWTWDEVVRESAARAALARDLRRDGPVPCGGRPPLPRNPRSTSACCWRTSPSTCSG
ncbi:hypothetical protein ACFQY7_28905 [Actinomadura luteofluorescens]|uniref:hypothetical protein n=1 Tax=Actinomadura luteofluorescens TaxID=46163 RepID=UPI00363C7C1A